MTDQESNRHQDLLVDRRELAEILGVSVRYIDKLRSQGVLPRPIKLGGRVVKGEKATPVVFWRILTRTERDDDGRSVERTVPVARLYYVFNLAQTDGVVREDVHRGLTHQPGETNRRSHVVREDQERPRERPDATVQ